MCRSDLDLVIKNNPCDVKDLLKALQLTIEFEGQLNKRYEKHVSGMYSCNNKSLLLMYLLQFKDEDKKEHMFNFEKSISAAFQPYLYIYINAEDA